MACWWLLFSLVLWFVQAVLGYVSLHTPSKTDSCLHHLGLIGGCQVCLGSWNFHSVVAAKKVGLYMVKVTLDLLIVLSNNMAKLDRLARLVNSSWNSRRATLTFFFKPWVYYWLFLGLPISYSASAGWICGYMWPWILSSQALRLPYQPLLSSWCQKPWLQGFVWTKHTQDRYLQTIVGSLIEPSYLQSQSGSRMWIQFCYSCWGISVCWQSHRHPIVWQRSQPWILGAIKLVWDQDFSGCGFIQW